MGSALAPLHTEGDVHCGEKLEVAMEEQRLTSHAHRRHAVVITVLLEVGQVRTLPGVCCEGLVACHSHGRVVTDVVFHPPSDDKVTQLPEQWPQLVSESAVIAQYEIKHPADKLVQIVSSDPTAPYCCRREARDQRLNDIVTVVIMCISRM